MNGKPPSGGLAEIWHAGEKALQSRTGVAERMEEVGRRNVRDAMPDQHRAFFAQLPFIVAGCVDDRGDPWATLLTGEPGFIASPTSTSLDIRARPDRKDPADAAMRVGGSIGLLGIELDTRRRNRANGVIRAASSAALQADIEQSFGNCPRYIQLRDLEIDRDTHETFAGIVEEVSGFDAAARASITMADTFFVASFVEVEGRRHVDVSHRGGKQGFVRVGADGTLTIPDFAGNMFFMTLGNILSNGKAGLVFADFGTGDLLQTTGDAALVSSSPEIAAFEGAERLWTFRARRVVRRRGALALRWSSRVDGSSPNAVGTGNWRQVAERTRASALAAHWRPLKVSKIVDESRSIRSFHLEPGDGAGLAPFRAGQHLPIRVYLDGSNKPTARTYTLSGGPTGAAYRISVKRGGAVSRHLHDDMKVGDIIEARSPAGGFTLVAGCKRPLVLLAGGIGVTPMLAMLQEVVHEGARTGTFRPATLFYATHSAADRAFDGELARLAEEGRGSIRIVRALGDPTGAREGVDFDAAGRLDMAVLSRFLPFGDYEFYLCGPSSFAQGLYDGLRGLNVADERIHAEAFGPSSLSRTGPAADAGPPPLPISSSPVRVAFASSGTEGLWIPGSGSLLDLAEARGLTPEFGCRSGNCGACKRKLLAGSVAYTKEATAEVGEGEVLICTAAPAEGEHLVGLDI